MQQRFGWRRITKKSGFVCSEDWRNCTPESAENPIPSLCSHSSRDFYSKTWLEVHCGSLLKPRGVGKDATRCWTMERERERERTLASCKRRGAELERLVDWLRWKTSRYKKQLDISSYLHSISFFFLLLSLWLLFLLSLFSQSDSALCTTSLGLSLSPPSHLISLYLLFREGSQTRREKKKRGKKKTQEREREREGLV